jgi:hypothetical protein
MIRGKNVKATARDIAEGFTTVNPLFLKALDAETLKELHQELLRGLSEIRRETFPKHDPQGIRLRNVRMQRLYAADMVLANYAKQKRIGLA